MKLEILDKKNELAAICYLCKVSLIDYIHSIKDTYDSYEVQRGIVSNRYLDRLAYTIAKKGHIPPISLVASKFSLKDSLLTVSDYEILDGLQRTHRLKVIWDVLNYLYQAENKINVINDPSRFARQNSSALRKIFGDAKLVRSLVELEFNKFNTAEEFLSNNYLWLEVWVNLSQSEQIEKMLLLNAGHKSVNIKHQLELLFLSTLIKFDEIAPNGVTFVREKDVSAIQYSKTRMVGQYHFSHLISSLIALSAKKIINTNADYISDLQANQEEYIELVEGFNIDFIKVFINFIFNLDKLLAKNYHDIGTKWLGREVVLIGLFAAIGEYSDRKSIKVSDYLNQLNTGDISGIVRKLDLSKFEYERNNVELNKVNVGNVNKKAVYLAVKDLLEDKPFLGWHSYFGGRS